jgi:glycosyltransferase involved in cell wall biosynthesis
MIITVFSDTKCSLPVKAYGGTERIIYWLMKELIKKGHTVYYIGHKECRLGDIGVTLIPFQQDIGIDWRSLIPKNTDIVQLFQNTADVDFPSLNTIGGNELAGTVFPINTVFVSKNHASRFHCDSFIYNGIDFDEYPSPTEFTRIKCLSKFAFLAMASWDVKNLKDCIRICHSVKKHLYVAGGNHKVVFKVFRGKNVHRYFNKGLSYYFSPWISYEGMLGQSGKISLFRKTDALLWPVRWHEPFGIAVIEAFSQGLPVFASPYGSMPELVPEFCGKLCANYGEFKAAIKRDEFDYNSAEIRSYCEKNFSSTIMAENYLQHYERILSGENINKTMPFSDFNKELLPF